MRCSSDSKMDRLPDSYTTVPISYTLDELDVVPYPHLLQREIAQENIQRESGANYVHETHGLCEGRINYELVLERELEYRKRLKDDCLLPFATNRVPPTPSQVINEKIMALDFRNCFTEIETVDSQISYQSGLLIVVTGSFTGQDNIRKKFAQSFFLAPQEVGGYFVLNDVFRFLNETQPRI